MVYYPNKHFFFYTIRIRELTFCRILQKGTRVPVGRVTTEARALERTTDTGANVPCVAARRPIRLLPVDWVRLVCRSPPVSIVHKQIG